MALIYTANRHLINLVSIIIFFLLSLLSPGLSIKVAINRKKEL
jgi:hypothetical protein